MDIINAEVSTTNGAITTVHFPTPRQLNMFSIVGKPTNSPNSPATELYLTMLVNGLHGEVVGIVQYLLVSDLIRSKPGIDGHSGKVFYPRTWVSTITNNEAFGQGFAQYYVRDIVFPVVKDQANPTKVLLHNNVTMYLDNYDPSTIPEGQFITVCLGFD